MSNLIDVWQNVQVKAQTALGAAVKVEGISKTNPVVVTAADHDLKDGDCILLDTAVKQLNDRAFKVAGVAGDTFKLEGEDGTEWDTFADGAHTFQKVTLGAKSDIIRQVNVSGGEPTYIDTTTIHTDQQREQMGSVSPLRIALPSLFQPDDPFFKEMRKASRTKTNRVVVFFFATGSETLGNFSVSAPGAPTGSAGQPVETNINLSAQAELTPIIAS